MNRGQLTLAAASGGNTTPEAFAAQWDFIAANFERLFTEPEHIAPLRQAIGHQGGRERARIAMKQMIEIAPQGVDPAHQ